MAEVSSAVVHRLSLRALLGGSSLAFSCRAIGALAAFGTQVLLARWLGADELGVYVVAFSLAVLLGGLGQLGFSSAAVRFIPGARANGDAGSLRGFLHSSCVAVAIGSTLFGVLGVAAALILDTVDSTTRHLPFVVASLMVPFMAFLQLFGAMANGFGWIGSAFIPGNVLRPVLALVALAVLWRLGHNLNATFVLLIQAGAALLCLLGLGLLIRARTVSLASSAPEYRTQLWVQTSLPLLVMAMFMNYFPDAVLLLLGAYLPSGEIGVFNAAYRIALFITFGLTAIDALFMPVAAGLHSQGDRQGLQRLVMRVTKVRLLGTIFALVALAAFGTQALSVFGEEFRDGYVALMLLAVAQLVHAAAGPVTALLSVTGHQRRCLPVFGYALVAAGLLIALLVPRLGIEGAALSILAVTVGWSLWLHNVVRNQLGIRPSPLSPALLVTKMGPH